MIDCSQNVELDKNVENSSIVEETNLEPEAQKQISDNNSSPEVNCLALTVQKDYNLSVVKHVFVRTWKTTWRVALSIFILNFLTFFF